MEGMELEETFHQLLGLGEQWEVTGLVVKEHDGAVEIHIAETEALWNSAQCPHDGSSMEGYDHRQERRWRHLNIFQYRCEIVCRLPRGRCRQCGKVSTIEAPWEGLTKHFTLSFEAMVLLLAKQMPVNSVASFVGEHDTRLWRILIRHTEKARSEKKMDEVDAVCCDELSVRKGHQYMTVFADARNRDVLFATATKEDITWRRFAEDLEQHGGDADKIRWASMDMSKSYQAGARRYAPNAHLVFDKFHLIKLANEAVDEIRRREMLQFPEESKSMKKQRYVWLKNPNNLTDTQQDALSKMSKQKLKTAKAYQMRLVLQEIYRSKNSLVAHRRLKYWVAWTKKAAKASELMKPMYRVGQTVLKHLDGILGYWDSDYLTNAFMEGLMSVFSATKRKARGYRSEGNLKAMLYLTASNLDIPFQPLFHTK